MAYKDLHEEPFDEGTIAKLELFEYYAQAWIPTFVMQAVPVMSIFDLFAGTGYDKNGVAGSPIRILEKIKEQIGYIFQKRVKIKLYLNEFEPNKKNQAKFLDEVQHIAAQRHSSLIDEVTDDNTAEHTHL